MKFLIPTLAIALFLLPGTALADDKKVEFQGKVSEVDLSAMTITVRARSKDYVFQIDPQRCKVVKDGRYPSIPGAQSPTLSSARVGDSVVGTLLVENSKPVVTELYLTTKPEPGVRVIEKTGYITSPYDFTSPLSPNNTNQRAIDVRGYARGTLLVDENTGKIFLVP